MKSHRTTIALAGVFLLGLLVLWGLEHAGVPTDAERRLRSGRVLPALLDVPTGDISRLQVSRGQEVLVFERRGREAWQLTSPMNVAADPSTVETLLRNLKDLRPSPDAGTIEGTGQDYGLSPPRCLVRLWRTGSSADGEPLAALEVGQEVRGQTFIRPLGSSAIEVVDGRHLSALEREIPELREQTLLPVPTFQVTRVAIRRNQAVISAERSPGGRWQVTTPVPAPANGAKIESLLAACASIRVVDNARGFVADDVTDFSPYGLDRPAATISLTTASRPGEPLVLEVGKGVKDQAERVYVRRADQDDVVSVSDRFLSELPDRSSSLRSQDVTAITSGAVTDVRIDALGKTFALHRRSDGWELTSPTTSRADLATVRGLLSQIEKLQASEFLEPSRVNRPELDPPVMAVKVWQQEAPSRGGPRPEETPPRSPSDPPALSLRIGRHDVLKKTVYGRLEGDDVILALPDVLLEHLPRNAYAYRDRGVLAIRPEQVRRLTVAREGLVTVLEPDRASSTPNQWKMIQPVNAVADVRALTQLLALLADLRAEDIAGDLVGEGREFGLDAPLITLSWELGPSSPGGETGTPNSTGWLKVGKPVPRRPDLYYAAAKDRPFVFTLDAVAIQAMAAELHDTRVLSFSAEEVRRLAFYLPGRTIAFVRRSTPLQDPSDWSAEAGTDPRGVDLSRFNELIRQLAQLRTGRFLQYEGPIPPATGLSRPRLTVEVDRTGDKTPEHLRIGVAQGPLVVAATGLAAEGPVFVLQAAAWEALIQSLSPLPDLPDDVFVP